MDKQYNQTEVEAKWYKFWEDAGYFKPEIKPKGKPYSIVLPPPNANANLHFGHAMYVVEDILIRAKRMQGFSTLWIPGADHAGFETQVVFERHLEAEGKSRFDFDRETLYQMIWDFVQENKGNMQSQLRRMGFSLDWSREKFTLDPDVIQVVYKTFKKLFDGGLVYKATRLVNFCTKHETSFSDLEVIYEDRNSKLYFIKYGPLTVATSRPETMLGDTAVAVNPDDKRYQDLIGQTIKLPLADREIPIIGDKTVDITFGTGAVKVTPAHSQTDFELAEKHNLEKISIIGSDGKMLPITEKYAGSTVMEARKAIVEDLEALGLLEKVEEYKNRVGVCYKCGTIIEPLLMPQWFIKIQPLAGKAIEAVEKGKVKIFPKEFEKTYFQWMRNIRDWNISRQIVWGIKIPAWYCTGCGKTIVTEGEKPKVCDSCGVDQFDEETDTFDTWFSSGQWPFATLQTTNDFEKFYPTSVLETGRDILFFWVARMIMLGIYATDKIPFKDVVLHGTVLDPLGKKMSKSKGNVVNPIELADQYGADATRFALVYGTAFGHDQALSHPKLQAMRNFTNKLWNMGRFIIEFAPEDAKSEISNHSDDQEIIKKLGELAEKVSRSIDQYRFHDGAEALYEFIWHEFADKYIESTKERRAEAQPTLEYVFKTSLELLHPFMPFITEELWQKLPHQGDSIMVTPWPK